MLLKPARNNDQDIPHTKIVCDFDALVQERVGFKFKGKIYLVNSVSVENYMEVTLAYRNLIEMVSNRSEGNVLDQNEVYQKYFDLIHPLVPDFTYADLISLPLALLNQLMNLIFRQIAGDPKLFDSSDEKKNPQKLTGL